MTETVIKVENVSKQYRLGNVGTGSLGHDLNRFWYKMRGKEDPYLKIGEVNDRSSKSSSDYVWALRDINFEVEQGEVLGIIGKNGAGKSTLLKLLSRTTKPTTGRMRMKGRVASLLEVGTGFHPELTGRQNIFLNGSILGMNRHEIRSKLDEIVDFSGVERYLDTPVKRYSSGMYVRLAFAVAAHLEPEILIVDEVLAVGDAEFQKKAIGKMKNVSEGQGRTVLFVSHNLSSIRSLCIDTLVLNKGEIDFYGKTVTAIDHYVNKGNLGENITKWVNDSLSIKQLHLVSVNMTDVLGNPKKKFKSSESVAIKFVLRALESINNVKVGFDLIKNHDVVFRSQQVDCNVRNDFQQLGKYELVGTIPNGFLNEGRYEIKPLMSVHCAEDLLPPIEGVLDFEIIIDPLNEFQIILNEQNHPGDIFPILQWTCLSND